VTYFLDFCKNIEFLMKIENELDNEIFQTLRQIKRTEKIIEFHQSQSEISELSVYQYIKMKEDLSYQLDELITKK
jgi:IS30 family transposase